MSLDEKLYLCLQDGIAEVSEGDLRHIPFSGAVSLCAGNSSLYCADHGGAIWRFDRKTMLEQSMGCGGPGVCDMCLSKDGVYLFSLLGEADSILMSDAENIRPLVVNRCGCNPQNMSLFENVIAVSGGESGYVHLFCAHTLECIAQILMPGAVCAVLFRDGVVYALCLSAEMNTFFVIWRGNEKHVISLEGMPGCISAWGNHLLIATKGRLYIYSPIEGCLLGGCRTPGMGSKICFCYGRIFLLDTLSDRVFVSQNGLPWRSYFTGVKCMAEYPGMVQ